MTHLISTPIATALARHPSPLQPRFAEIRALIFEVAAQTDGVGPLTECLKWGEPAYLTDASRSGSTIRLGVVKSRPNRCAVFFNCQTTLIETFRTQFAEVFDFDKNRALILRDGDLPRAALALCLQAALTYHRTKASGAGRRRVQQDIA